MPASQNTILLITAASYQRQANVQFTTYVDALNNMIVVTTVTCYVLVTLPIVPSFDYSNRNIVRPANNAIIGTVNIPAGYFPPTVSYTVGILANTIFFGSDNWRHCQSKYRRKFAAQHNSDNFH